MKSFISRNQLGILGIFLGGILDFAYYHFVGCGTGTCAITSKPINSTTYGMIVGYLMFSLFQKSKNSPKNV